MVFSERLLQKDILEICRSTADYLDSLEKIRTSEDNNFFGIKIQPNQLINIFGESEKKAAHLLSRFDKIILLTRKSRVKQAISTLIAEKTGKWLCDGSDKSLSLDIFKSEFPRILEIINRFNEEDIYMKKLLNMLKTPVLEISYEEISENEKKLISKVITFLSSNNKNHELYDVVRVARKNQGDLEKLIEEAFQDFCKSNNLLVKTSNN